MALTQVKTTGIADDAVTLAKQAAGTDGQIITYDASGNPTAVGPGTDGQVLTSTGAGSPPAFEDAASSGAALTGSTNNTVCTVTGANAIQGEANLTFDGSNLSVTGGFDVSSDVSIADTIKHTGDTNTKIRFPAADTVSIETNGSEKFRVSSAITTSGSDQGIGTFGSHSWAPKFQVLETQGLAVVRSDDDVWGGSLHLASSRGNYSSRSAAASGDRAGAIYFEAYDGTDWQNYVGGIECFLSDTVGSNDTPGYLTFSTANDGANTLTERLRILSGGGITFNGDTAATNALNDYEEGTFTPTIKHDTDATGATDGVGAYTKVGNMVTCNIAFINKTASSIPNGAIAAITGLPFTANHPTGQADGFSTCTKPIEMSLTQRNGGLWHTVNGTTKLRAHYMANNSTWAIWYIDDFNNNSLYLIFNITYWTDS